VISSLHDHWDSILANTVPVPGCRCAFCDIRPAAEKQRRKWKPRTQASAPIQDIIDNVCLAEWLCMYAVLPDLFSTRLLVQSPDLKTLFFPAASQPDPKH
jgi:hypothetical protein